MSTPESSQPLSKFDSWSEFAERLATTLSGFPDDTFLIISVEGTKSRYIQFAQGGRLGFRAEVVSNTFLEENEKWDQRAEEQLADLGWLPPGPNPARPGGNVNHYRKWPHPAPLAPDEVCRVRP